MAACRAAQAAATDPANSATAAAAPAARRYDRLLRFASDGINPVRVHISDQLGGGGGRGLVADCDVPAGGVLLSVPLPRIFASQVRLAAANPLKLQLTVCTWQTREHVILRLHSLIGIPSLAFGSAHAERACQLDKGPPSTKQNIPFLPPLLPVLDAAYFQPDPELTIHWAAEMGLRLLQERHTCRQAAASRRDSSSSSSSSSSSGGGGGGGSSGGSGGSPWCDWIACLPERVITPLEFTADQVARCGVPCTTQV
jgi:hypothetical protein